MMYAAPWQSLAVMHNITQAQVRKFLIAPAIIVQSVSTTGY